MNAREYKEYCSTVNAFFKREGITNLTAIADDDGDVEAHFSSRNCDCCDRPLGGDREDCEGSTESGEVFEYSICLDCVYFAEYGRLDDQTMMEIEDS